MSILWSISLDFSLIKSTALHPCYSLETTTTMVMVVVVVVMGLGFDLHLICSVGEASVVAAIVGG
ncbi:hypothetical protein Syun_025366 [Stephania yunnanensis]|uniref:Uncharacterized protein n=1 Tax=Stephania yunnanensis TaxID=152371 RepID=A0AAP0ES27_9MAGN